MKRITIIIAIILSIGFFYTAAAHPASGIVVDKYGNVFFIYSRNGVVKIAVDGKLSYIHKSTDGHWMCLDEQGFFSRTRPRYFERITPDGIKPAIIFAGGGSPIVVNRDGNFYYCGGQHGNLDPGGLTLVRETPDGGQTNFSPHLEDTLNRLDDGITGIAASRDSSLYLACWNSLIRVAMDGKVTTLLHPITVSDCDEDPADHNENNRSKLLLRGLAVDSDGAVYVAATSCHCVVKIAPDGKVKTILKSRRPWSPTGVAIHNGDIYVLEYTNANGPATEGWIPRVRKLERDGKITTLADFSITKTHRVVKS